MRTSRFLMAVAITTAMVMTSLAPAGAQADRRLTVTGSPVAAGGTIRVEGGGCGGASAVAAVMTADGEGHLAMPQSATPGEDGSWSTELRVDSGARPGLYSVVARCLGSYGGYDGYDGDDPRDGDGAYNGDGDGAYNGDGDGDGGAPDPYNGGNGGFEYPPVDVEVLPPPALPSSDGPLTVSPDVATRGQIVSVTGDGWQAGEQVTVMVYSTPQVLGRVVTDSQGAIDADVRVPTDATLGQHTVVAMNASSATTPGLTLSAPITVVERRGGPNDPPTARPIAQPAGQQPGTPTAVGGATQQPGGATLPFTGGNPWPYVALGLLLLAIGGELYRRSRASAAAG